MRLVCAKYKQVKLLIFSHGKLELWGMRLEVSVLLESGAGGAIRLQVRYYLSFGYAPGYAPYIYIYTRNENNTLDMRQVMRRIYIYIYQK